MSALTIIKIIMCFAEAGLIAFVALNLLEVLGVYDKFKQTEHHRLAERLRKKIKGVHGEMTLYEYLKRFTKQSLDEYVALFLAGGKVYDGQIRNIPALYILRPYTVKTVRLDWGAQALTIELNVPEEGET